MSPSETHSHSGSYRLLAALTLSASAVLAIYTASTSSALGFSSVIFAATGFVLFEAAGKGEADDRDTKTRGLASTTRRSSISGARKEQQLATLRDIAAIIMTTCGIASYFMEPSLTASSISWEPLYREYDQDWRTVHNHRILQQVLWMIPVNVLVNVLTFVTVSTVIFLISSYILSQPQLKPRLSVFTRLIWGSFSHH